MCVKAIAWFKRTFFFFYSEINFTECSIKEAGFFDRGETPRSLCFFFFYLQHTNVDVAKRRSLKSAFGLRRLINSVYIHSATHTDGGRPGSETHSVHHRATSEVIRNKRLASLASCPVEFYSQLPSPLYHYRVAARRCLRLLRLVVRCRRHLRRYRRPETLPRALPSHKPPPSRSLVFLLSLSSSSSLLSPSSYLSLIASRNLVAPTPRGVCINVHVYTYVYTIYNTCRTVRGATERRIRVAKLTDADIAFRYVARNRE